MAEARSSSEPSQAKVLVTVPTKESLNVNVIVSPRVGRVAAAVEATAPPGAACRVTTPPAPPRFKASPVAAPTIVTAAALALDGSRAGVATSIWSVVPGLRSTICWADGFWLSAATRVWTLVIAGWDRSKVPPPES